MNNELIYNALYYYSYIGIYFITIAYFLALYFGVGILFKISCKWLSKMNIMHQIIKTEISNKNIRFEIKHSLKSIIIFGFSGVILVYLIRNGIVILTTNTLLTIIFGLFILNIWNEIYFYIVHRILHTSFFYRNIHKIHHQSKIPTVFSIYSFHSVEASLLCAVPLIISPFIPFSIYALILYPFTQVLLNFAGHCNYRFGNGDGHALKEFATRHNQHHYLNSKKYGFATDLLDRLSLKLKKHVK